MKLWMSGEVDADVGDMFRHALNVVELEVNEFIEKKNYGQGLESWDVICIISKTGGDELCKYSKKNKETDIRIVVDHTRFLSGSSKVQKTLLMEALLRSIFLLKEKKVTDIDYENLKQDIEKLNEK